MLMYRLAVMLCLALTFNAALAEDYVMPQEISEFGHLYKLAYQKISPDRRQAIYEYTTGSESIENWTRLLTVQYAKLNTDAMAWGVSTKKALEATSPKPHFQVYAKAGHGYAVIIFEPDAKNPAYEANAHKSFHMGSCGLFTLQHAVKYDASAEQSEDGRQRTLIAIVDASRKMVADVEQAAWQPDCDTNQ
jgi:hypothetical protein